MAQRERIQDPKEPAVLSAKLSLVGPLPSTLLEKFEAVTDSAGDYRVENVPAGGYELHVQADPRFSYMFTSTEEFRAVTPNYYDLCLNEPQKIDIGLMKESLTLPLHI